MFLRVLQPQNAKEKITN